MCRAEKIGILGRPLSYRVRRDTTAAAAAVVLLSLFRFVRFDDVNRSVCV